VDSKDMRFAHFPRLSRGLLQNKTHTHTDFVISNKATTPDRICTTMPSDDYRVRVFES